MQTYANLTKRCDLCYRQCDSQILL